MALWRVLGIDELGSVCRQHLLVGTSAANALDALAKFIGRSVPFVWNEESQWLYQSYADRLGAAEKYFATNDCVRFELTVFAPNKSAYSFYVKHGFEPRLHHMIRKIER